MHFPSSVHAWQQLLYISSLETAQQFLLKKYMWLFPNHARKKSYENSSKFLHHIEQGKIFFQQSETAPLSIKPIFLFYGLSFLLKGALLITDPNYPENVKVLAHGVSTRKRKKQDYEYLKDEVKIQKNGFFPHISKKMFHMEHLEGKKMNIGDLLCQIPELMPFFQERNVSIIPLFSIGDGTFQIVDDVFDAFHMTPRRFFHYLNGKSNQGALFQWGEDGVTFTVNEIKPPIEILPFRFHLMDQKYYFIDGERSLSFFHELLIHYLLLYHLSMLARYEIEWWSELLSMKSTVEYPLIEQYLHICLLKCPLLIHQYLFDDETIEKKG
ncbi:YaaC family protein [Fervidibacillus albus]|uniref:YaaC family protein n=1 Tax=Fervidibacillus albus TaxID=2980026 RepID=A0A9E8RUF8_9BACI|nr:YaaC family protein [Fervidibacillus albus]WAA09525.1 YaaC family protein [Fervidibacillus albus]